MRQRLQLWQIVFITLAFVFYSYLFGIVIAIIGLIFGIIGNEIIVKISAMRCKG